MARQVYGPQLTDHQLLALDPNDIDEMDPAMFYELIGERYGVQADDDNNDNFGGFGGTIAKLIDFVAKHWDGTTNQAIQMPPGEWVEDFVHPAGEKAVESAAENAVENAAPPPQEEDEEEQDYRA
jgi:hypothetical protein